MQADGIGAHHFERLAQVQVCQMPEILVPHGRPRPVKTGIADQQLGKRIRARGGIRHSPVLPCGRALVARL